MSSDGDWTVRNGRAMEGMVVETKEGKLDLDSICVSISSLLGFACSTILPGTSGPGLSLVREVFALVIRRTLLCFITLACWKRSEWEELWKHLGLSAIATIPSAQTAPHYQRLKKALCPPLPHLWSLIRRVASSVPPLFPPLPPVLSHIGDFLSDQSILSEHISCTAWNSFDLEKNLTVNTRDIFWCCII